MRVGLFADSHDHLDNIRRAVKLFNERECACVLFAGDLVSTFVIPPLRELNAPLLGCYGDNEGNKPGLQAGFSIVGEVREAPALFTLEDGTRVAMAHMQRQLRGFSLPFDIAVYGHTHRPSVHADDLGRLWINPGETSGWTYGAPTVALLDTVSRQVDIIPLPIDQPLVPWNQARRQGGQSTAGPSAASKHQEPLGEA